MIDNNDKFRSIVPLIREQLPDYVLDAESVLPDFLEAYYEWMEKEGNPTEIINQAALTNDISYTLDRFYSEFKEEYLNRFPNALEANKENLIKNIREFYRSKGTEKGVKLLFRILFNEEIEVQYPSERILRPSDGTWVKKTIIRVTDIDDSIFDVNGREVFFLEQKVVVSGVSGTYLVGETVDAKDNLGNVYNTGEIHSITNNEIIITTDFSEQFQKNLILEGRDSNATGIIIESEDFSKRAIIENVSKLNTGETTYYECEVSGLFDTVKSGLIVRTITNNDSNPVIEFRNSSMIVSATINNPGTEYDPNTEISLSDSGDGEGFSAIVSSVKSITKDIPGTFAAVSPLPSDVLEYTPDDSETIQEYFFPGDKIRIGSDRYTVISVDRSTQRITTSEDITAGSDLGSIVKSYERDNRGISEISITNAGFGYSSVPVADLTGDGDGNADITFVSGGSFVEDFGYTDDKGQLSSSMRIQNDGLFQEFSYLVRSGNAINLWREILIDHAHPAGMLVSGEIFSTQSNSETMNLSLYHSKRNDGRVNYNNPNYISTRNFFEPIIFIGGRYSIEGLRIDSGADASYDSFFEFVLPESFGSYYEQEWFDVAILDNGPTETIDVLNSSFGGDNLYKFSQKHFRADSIIIINSNTFEGDGFLLGASSDLRFDADAYMVNGVQVSDFSSIPGLSASGGANGTVVRGGQVVSASAPRVGDDGLLVENESTELFSYSGDISDTMWLVESGLSRGAAPESPPVQGATAQRFTVSSGNGRVRANPSAGIGHTSGTTYTCFMVARPGPDYKYLIARFNIASPNNNFVTLAFDTDAISVAQSGPQYDNASIKPLANGYFICRFEFTPDETTTGSSFYFGATDSLGASPNAFSPPVAASYYDLALVSIQEGVHTSPIISTGTAFTRTSDSVTLTNLDVLGLTSAVLAAGYTVAVEFIAQGNGNEIMSFYGGATTEAIRLHEAGTGIRLRVNDNSVGQADLNSGNFSLGDKVRAVLRVNENNFGLSVNGASPSSDNNGSVPSIYELYLGAFGPGIIGNSNILSVTIIPRAVSDSELQALSS